MRFGNSSFQNSPKNGPSYPSLLTLISKESLQDQCSSLNAPFNALEIRNAICDCGCDKAPGPNGSTFKFLKSHWDSMENDITEITRYF